MMPGRPCARARDSNEGGGGSCRAAALYDIVEGRLVYMGLGMSSFSETNWSLGFNSMRGGAANDVAFYRLLCKCSAAAG
jgi:hypothetical protein